MKLRIWRPKYFQAKDGREYWSTSRKVSCSACGDDARHYRADYDGKLTLFTVPYAKLNGGIGRELEASYWELGNHDIDNVFLSECCDAPRTVQRRR